MYLLFVVAKQRAQIKAAVINGERPDLSVIKGPETLLMLALDMIQRCWHQNPDRRPTFTGIDLCFDRKVSIVSQ